MAEVGIRKDVFAAMSRAVLDRQPGQKRRAGQGLWVNGCGQGNCSLKTRRSSLMIRQMIFRSIPK